RHVNKLRTRLRDNNPIVRYWAAIGCTVLGKQAMIALPGLVALFEDPEPCVRIAAAEAMYAINHSTDALPVLADVLSNDNLYVRLQALTVLEGMGDDAMPALPVIEQMVYARTDKA